jgi:ABC-type transport system involved in multi-copper enzyme maturation permease subunit
MWVVILNGLMAIIITTGGDEGEVTNIAFSTVEPYMGISFWFTSIGIMIIAQNAIIGEKLSGTAAWVLSGPVSRTSFILAKLIPIAIGSLITMIILPFVIAYFEFSFMPADGSSLAFMSLLAGQSAMALQLMFFLSLTFLAGTLFNSRGLVITLPVVVWFGSLLPLDSLPSWLVNITPWPITTAATALARGETPDSLIPLVSTAVWIVVFVTVAIRRFQREEF